jgi:hypothetical protein
MGIIFKNGFVVGSLDAFVPPSTPTPTPTQNFVYTPTPTNTETPTTTPTPTNTETPTSTPTPTPTNGIDGSASFSGANFLTVNGNTGTAMETVDFTWECWVYPTSSLDYQAFLDSRQNPLEGGDTTGYYFGTNINTLTPIVYTNGIVLQATGDITLNEWNHVALTRSSGTIDIWINGVNRGNTTDSTNLTNQRIFIGGDAISNGLNLTGNLSNIRITKGVAVYATNFTIPTTNFTVTQTANVNGNPSAEITAGQTQLLLNTNFGDGFLTDTSTNNFTVVNNGGVISSNYEPFTPIPGPTPTPTTTYTPTNTPTTTITPSITPTNSVTPTPSVTTTITPTNSVTPSITPTTVTSTLITDGLFMELNATDYISGNWNDRTVNGNNATINGATWLSDNGGIFDLDGVNDTIQIPHKSNFSLNTSTQRTIQVWVKFDTLPALNAQGQPVFGKLSSSFGFDGYWGGLFSNAGKTRIVTNGTGVQRITDSTTNPVSVNTWYLYTFISQITATANTTKVYINTTEVSSTAHGSDGYGETNPLYLGYIGTGISSTFLDGKIGAAYFYTKGLSALDVTNNFNVTKSKYGL